MGDGGNSERLERIAEGLYRFDTHYIRPRHTAAFVVVEAGRVAIIDPGPAPAVEPLVAAIESLGLSRDAIDAVIATHSHLDHSGGIGKLMAALPQVQLYAHAAAARHLIDPSKLAQGTRAVLGDELIEREHEPLIPAPAERVLEASDGMVVPPAGRGLTIVHTPGHARDHVSVWDARSRTVIAGDAFGIAYPELDGPKGPFVIAETPQTQFDPDAMHASIDRLVALAPEQVAPTHFSVLTDPAAVAADLHAIVDEYIARCRDADSVEALEDSLLAAYEQALERRGRGDEIATMRPLYEFDARLAARGVWQWHQRQQRRSP